MTTADGRIQYPHLTNMENATLHNMQRNLGQKSPEFLEALADWARARAVQNRIADDRG